MTGLQGLLIDKELVVIPSKTRIDRPVSQMDEILDECGLLQVWPLRG